MNEITRIFKIHLAFYHEHEEIILIPIFIRTKYESGANQSHAFLTPEW